MNEKYACMLYDEIEKTEINQMVKQMHIAELAWIDSIEIDKTDVFLIIECSTLLENRNIDRICIEDALKERRLDRIACYNR